MILQALCEYYDRKAANGKMPPYGREWKPIPYLVIINSDGGFIRLESTLEGEGKDKKTHEFLMPYEVKGRTSTIKPNNLYDKATYVFGSANDGDVNEKDKLRLKSFIKRVNCIADLNQGVPYLESVCKFYNRLDSNIILLKKDKLYEEAMKRTNNLFAFKVVGSLNIVGEENLKLPEEKKNTGRCLVTGEAKVPLVRIGKKLKIKSAKAQSSGVVLVGFNLTPFESYGNKQGNNAPISEEADFKYNTALEYLLNSKKNCLTFAGDKLVFWASKDNQFEDVFSAFFTALPQDDPDSNVERISALMKAPLTGSLIDDDETHFYLLLLSPNSARISVKLWEENSVKTLANNIRQYFIDLNIVRSQKNEEFMPLANLLRSISFQYKEDNLPPQLFQSMMRAILEGLPFPELLQTQTIGRIRADRTIDRNRAALLKAYLNRKRNNKEKQITMSLDLTNANQGYLCGRLFAIYEKIQQEANPGLNSTIRDQYYDSFSCTPTVAFARLAALSNHHLQKLPTGRQAYFERLKGEVIRHINADGLPSYFSLDDQARFAIGYYHQRQDFFKKKEETGKETV